MAKHYNNQCGAWVDQCYVVVALLDAVFNDKFHKVPNDRRTYRGILLCEAPAMYEMQ